MKPAKFSAAIPGAAAVLLALGHDVVPQAAKFRGVAAQPPELPRHPGQLYRLLERAVVHQPGQRGQQIVVLALQPVQPGQLSRPGQLGRGRLGQRPELGSVPVMRQHPVATGGEAFQRVLPDGLQQREPRLAAAGVRPDQAASTSDSSVSITGPGPVVWP